MYFITLTFQVIDWFETTKFVFLNMLMPIIIALVTYFVVDRLGEFKKRRAYSLLGVAVIESLQEEVNTGIQTMKESVNVANDANGSGLPNKYLPNKSWSGMTTINDDVLLRIIETSKGKKYDGFPPRECRIHCKNYFEHMIKNYEQIVVEYKERTFNSQKWRNDIRQTITGEESHYLSSAINVYDMLENSKLLLERNAQAKFPK